MATTFRMSRTRQGAATLRLAASSVAPVAAGYERSRKRPWRERHCDAGVSRLTRTSHTKGDR
jgi:hypothetical protein